MLVVGILWIDRHKDTPSLKSRRGLCLGDLFRLTRYVGAPILFVKPTIRTSVNATWQNGLIRLRCPKFTRISDSRPCCCLHKMWRSYSCSQGSARDDAYMTRKPAVSHARLRQPRWGNMMHHCYPSLGPQKDLSAYPTLMLRPTQ